MSLYNIKMCNFRVQVCRYGLFASIPGVSWAHTWVQRITYTNREDILQGKLDTGQWNGLDTRGD